MTIDTGGYRSLLGFFGHLHLFFSSPLMCGCRRRELTRVESTAAQLNITYEILQSKLNDHGLHDITLPYICILSAYFFSMQRRDNEYLQCGIISPDAGLVILHRNEHCLLPTRRN